jgi:hypothetical protein
VPKGSKPTKRASREDSESQRDSPQVRADSDSQVEQMEALELEPPVPAIPTWAAAEAQAA